MFIETANVQSVYCAMTMTICKAIDWQKHALCGRINLRLSSGSIQLGVYKHKAEGKLGPFAYII